MAARKKHTGFFPWIDPQDHSKGFKLNFSEVTYIDEQPWVKAKSIFPILSLQKRARIFQHIGSKPIGWLLFQRTNPYCERRVIYLEDGWTRQSCYTWHGCKFIVQETFLPAFQQYIENQQA